MKLNETARLLGLLLLGAGALPAIAGSEQPVTPNVSAHPTPTIEIHGDGSFSVVADDVPLSEMLAGLQRRAGFKLIENADTTAERISVEFKRLSWEEGVDELLVGWRYALSMDPSTQLPDTLVVLSWEDGQPAPLVSTVEQEPDDTTRRETSFDEATRIARELLARQEDPLSADLRSVEEARAAAERARAGDEDDKTEDGNQRYAAALLQLGRYQSEATLPALMPALSHADRGVRGSALRAMRWGTVSDADALSKVREMINTDANPRVRREAFEVYSRYGDQDDVLTLAQELGRQDGVIQDIAVREWLRIEKEREGATLADEQIEAAMEASGQ